jgi:rhamnogalacturonyl hydrolase YesR
MKFTPIALALLMITPLFVKAETVNPTPSDVLKTMEKVADYQISHPGSRAFTDWVQAAFLTGLSSLDSISDSPRFHQELLKIAEGNQWQLGERMYHADDLCVGQTYYDLYSKEHDPKMLKALQERCDYILAHPKSGSLEFVGKTKTDQWTWCDSLFMAPPAWLRLYVATGNKAYRDYAVTQWWRTTAYLYDTKEHLYFRDSTYFNKREMNGQKIFWSRGNGWVIAGLARFLTLLPANDPARPEFEQEFKEMASRIKALQPANGAWSSSLLDPESCSPRVETSGTGFYCFALAWGVNNHLLEHSEYAPAALKAWSALNTCVEESGRLNHVQPVGAAPQKFSAESTEAYGIGAFLLAGHEIITLISQK